jgi:hypothetical protein
MLNSGRAIAPDTLGYGSYFVPPMLGHRVCEEATPRRRNPVVHLRDVRACLVRRYAGAPVDLMVKGATCTEQMGWSAA